MTELTQEQIAELEAQAKITLMAEGQEVLIELEDVEIISEDIPGWTVTNEGAVTVALDITITPELEVEGNARRIVKQIQALRKSSGLEITDRLTVVVSESAETKAAVEKLGDHIASQVLATSLTIGNADGGTEIDLDTFKLTVKIEKA